MTSRSHKVEKAHSREKEYVSQRGSFEIFDNPPINRLYTWHDADLDHVADGWDIGVLGEKHDDATVRKKLGEMIGALAGGMVTTGLFCQGGRDPTTHHQLQPNGMSIGHVWIGPNFPLFRHGHPAHGDCLYFVMAGELIMGKRHLGPGSGFFLPNGMPYKYTGGPDGAELLEIRAGTGDADAPGLTLHEQSMESIQRIIDSANEHRDEWEAPERIGDTALRGTEKASESG